MFSEHIMATEFDMLCQKKNLHFHVWVKICMEKSSGKALSLSRKNNIVTVSNFQVVKYIYYFETFLKPTHSQVQSSVSTHVSI